MPPGLPCPNPVCTHVFPPDVIKGAALLKCPRCGHSFQFRPTTPAAPPPAAAKKPPSPPPKKPPPAPAKRPPEPVPTRVVPVAPVAKAVPPKPATPPAARPVAPPAVPLAAPVPLASAVVPAETHSSPTLAPPRDFVSPRLRRGSDGPAWVKWLPLLIIGFVLSLGIGLAVGFWEQVRGFAEGYFNANSAPDDTVFDSKLLGYQFVYPSPRVWQLDNQTKLDLRCAIAMRRADPNSWFAILTQDYKKQTPTEADLVEEGVRRMREYFVKDESKDFFEYQIDSGRDHKLADQKAVRVDFKADLNSVTMAGEMYMMGYRGVGFWFVTWSPRVHGEVSREEWGKLRSDFRLSKERDGWTGEPAEKLAAVEGTKVGYRFVYNDVVWDTDNPMNYDPSADMLLIGRDVNEAEKREKSAYAGARTAYASLLVLPKTDSTEAAVAAAKDHVLKQQQVAYKETTIDDPLEGSGRTEFGAEPGYLVRLKVRNSNQRIRLIYLAVIRQIEQTLVIELECGWDYRTYWEVNFQQLLRRFQLVKKGN